MLSGTRVTIPFDTGEDVGDIEQVIELDAFDLSHCRCLDMHIVLTTAADGADDLFEVVFEETHDRVTWDERIHSHQFAGSMTVSDTAPEVRNYRCSSHINLDTTEEGYETTGSAGGTPLDPGQVRNGPFAPKLFGTSGAGGLQKTSRLRFVTDDDDEDAQFAGVVTLTFHSPL